MSKKVAIFPGHWGKDPGAIDKFGHEDDKLFSIEAVLNAAISARVQERLWRMGFEAMLFVGTFPHRITQAKLWKPDVSVSIHCDSFTHPAAIGRTVYYWENTRISKPLATAINERCDMHCEGIDSRASKGANFYILRKTPGPIVLVECGFLSNPEEERILNTSKYQSQIAQGIVDGLVEFLERRTT
jgi:N-acetylmuramoyl-L-alanine amidase